LEAGLRVAAVIAFAAALMFGRNQLALRPTQLPPGLVGVGVNSTPAELKELGARSIETAVAKGGGGVSFEIVQRASLHAKPGGPKIDVPAPVGRGSAGTADEYEVGATIEHGRVTPDGFWMEMRAGPAPGRQPDFDHATYEFGAIVKAGTTYRNDGQGWYETDDPPGIGLDPRTAALLPRLLRNAAAAKDAGTDADLRKITAQGEVRDVPGLIAVDGETFTSLVGDVELGFDDQGRLRKLHVVAQNGNVSRYDLLVDTVITFDYPAQAEPIPDPTPAAKLGAKG
jgi:hypothetical protein